MNGGGSRRRIDLLGIDEQANLVVFELKVDYSGRYAELQALRYSALISKLDFDHAVEVYKKYGLKSEKKNIKAKNRILKHLEIDDPNDVDFGKDVRIVLVAQEFTFELLTSVLWLNEKKRCDIRCVKVSPYLTEDKRLFVRVETLVPLPQDSDYQITPYNADDEWRIKKEHVVKAIKLIKQKGLNWLNKKYPRSQSRTYFVQEDDLKIPMKQLAMLASEFTDNPYKAPTPNSKDFNEFFGKLGYKTVHDLKQKKLSL